MGLHMQIVPYSVKITKHKDKFQFQKLVCFLVFININQGQRKCAKSQPHDFEYGVRGRYVIGVDKN